MFRLHWAHNIRSVEGGNFVLIDCENNKAFWADNIIPDMMDMLNFLSKFYSCKSLNTQGIELEVCHMKQISRNKNKIKK